jgi:flagellar motor switch protein FliN
MPSSETNDRPLPTDSALPVHASSGDHHQFPASPFEFPEFGDVDPLLGPGPRPADRQRGSTTERSLQIELGRTRLDHQLVAALRSGSVVPLDKQAGHSMEIYVSDQLIARGELLVMDGKFCVRITQRFSHEPLA